MLAAVDLYKTYGPGTAAVRGVSIALEPGSCLGLTGESGSGKSTLARLLCCLEWGDRGRVELEGRIPGPGGGLWRGASLKEFRRRVQIVFQDSAGSLDPRLTLGQALAEPLGNFDPAYRRAPRGEKLRRVEELLERVGLEGEQARRYPHELSGGQRQRGVIARALAANPRYLLCDEPVSSLDRENRDKIVELLAALRRETGMGCLFISHDPALTARICGRIHVMREGRIVETLPGGPGA